MGNYSVYVYNTINDYMALYPKGQSELSENHVDGLLLFYDGRKSKFVVITNYKKNIAGYKPDISRTLIYYNGGIEEFEKKFPKFQPITDVKYFPKSALVDFEDEHGNNIRLVCAKYIGEKQEVKFYDKSKSVKGFILFDEQHNRLNLILTNVDN